MTARGRATSRYQRKYRLDLGAVNADCLAAVLLLDEPLASLDPLARRDFLSVVVRHVRSAGRTAVLSSHIVTDVEQACDRIVILSAGELLLHASIADARATHRVVSSGDRRLKTELPERVTPGQYQGRSKLEPILLDRDFV
jgi:ABC-type multidrug transport system ATPase subunit